MLSPVLLQRAAAVAEGEGVDEGALALLRVLRLMYRTIDRSWIADTLVVLHFMFL